MVEFATFFLNLFDYFGPQGPAAFQAEGLRARPKELSVGTFTLATPSMSVLVKSSLRQENEAGHIFYQNPLTRRP